MIDNIDAIIQGQATATFGGARTTAKLLAILGELNESGVPTLRQIKKVGPLPVGGLAYWVDDWHAYRCCPKPHLHEGLDLMAENGTPLLAVAKGVISRKVNDPSWSGLAVSVTDDSGTRYSYAHLSAFASGIGVGQRVRVGDVLGYVGNTGNAAGGPTHLHFEVHPYGGEGVPPKPYVDRWLDASEDRAFKLVRRITGRRLTDEDLDLGLWKDKLLALAQQEIQASNLQTPVRAAARKPRVGGLPDQQILAYTLPLLLLAVSAGSLLFLARLSVPAWLWRRRGPPYEAGDNLAVLEDLDHDIEGDVAAAVASEERSIERALRALVKQ